MRLTSKRCRVIFERVHTSRRIGFRFKTTRRPYTWSFSVTRYQARDRAAYREMERRRSQERKEQRRRVNA